MMLWVFLGFAMAFAVGWQGGLNWNAWRVQRVQDIGKAEQDVLIEEIKALRAWKAQHVGTDRV